MNQLVVKCMIFLSQNNIPQFVSSIVAPGSVSSSILNLLNETSLEEGFASILWQFVQRALKIDSHVLYCSDEMVLIDILLRYLHDLPHTHVVGFLFVISFSCTLSFIHCYMIFKEVNDGEMK